MEGLKGSGLRPALENAVAPGFPAHYAFLQHQREQGRKDPVSAMRPLADRFDARFLKEARADSDPLERIA
jgi:hypothetical protein